MKYEYRKHTSRLSVIQVTFTAGSRVEKDKYPHGLAHFMEHFRFKGTDKYSSKELTRGVAFEGGSWNAYTSNDLVSYHITVPEENLEKAVEYLSEIVLHPTFPEDELAKEKEVVCQEIRMYDEGVSNRAFYAGASHILGTRNIIGTEETVNTITIDNLKEFNKEFYTKEHMLISLVSRSDWRGLVEKYFGVIDDVFVKVPKSKFTPGEPKEITVSKEGIIQTDLGIKFAQSSVRKEDAAKRFVFNCIFGGTGDSRLFDKVREDLGLVYGIGSYTYDTFDGTVFEIGTDTDPENVDKVIEAVNGEIDRMISEPPTEEELHRAKNAIRSGEYKSIDSPGTASSRVINEVFYDKYYGSKLLADVDSVTAEDVHEIAKEVFSGNRYTVFGINKEKES